VLRVGRAPERVLAIAADEGEAALFLAREFPAARVRGLDRSRRRVRATAERIGLDPEGRVAFKAGSGAFPYPDGFFDLVAQVDGRPAVAEIARVLRPGGYLILARTQGSRGRRGLTSRSPWRRLGRRGIALLESGEAGDGSFSVGRRDEGGPGPSAD
jgi:SAM-dependent methyltransferase